MSKVLVYSENEKFREDMKHILEEKKEMILTDSYEMLADIIKNTSIEVVITDSDVDKANLTGVKVIVIDKYLDRNKILSMFE